MYRNIWLGKKKANYKNSPNATGKTCGIADIPSNLREMLESSIDGDKRHRWIAGAEIMRMLTLEAMEDDGEACLLQED